MPEHNHDYDLSQHLPKEEIMSKGKWNEKQSQGMVTAEFAMYQMESLKNEIEIKNKKIEELEAGRLKSDEQKDKRIAELEDGLREIDFPLSMMEDYFHGSEGQKITKIRGTIQQLLTKNPV